MLGGRFISKWLRLLRNGSFATVFRSRAFSSIPSSRALRGKALPAALRPSGKKINVEKFLIFNQQFVTLIRAGLPILKALDLLADRLTDPKLSKYINGVREEIRNGALLSDAFAKQGVFPPIYVTSVLAGERSGSLGEVLERFISYQKLSLSVRKKLLVSLLYPAVLVFLVVCLIVFLVTYVVPNFAVLYATMDAQLPAPTRILIAIGTTARNYVLRWVRGAGWRDFWVSILGAHACGRRTGRPVSCSRFPLRARCG